MDPSFPTLKPCGNEHSNCTPWAQRIVEPNLSPPAIQLLDFLYGEWGVIQDQFDFIIIDTPPTLGIFTQAPLVASTEILIPVDVGYFSLQGIRQLLEEIASVRQVFNPTLDKKKILLTKFDSRTTLSAQVREILRESFGEDALKTVINVNVDIVRAQIERKSIFAYDLTSTGALDYQNVVEELLGNTVAVQPSGNVIPFRKKRRGVGALKESKSGRAAKAD
jgi:cellulose biosynthesis protein BcsQ